MNQKTLLTKLCIAALIIVMGCTKSETGPSGLTNLVKITQEAAGSNCANGGFKIETGVDTNKNSVLDSDEIQNTAYICNGANGSSGTSGTNGNNGLTSLIKVTAESAGANCANGGYRIDTGIDDNADGILEANEINNTIYVCSGSDGNLINTGKQTLVLAGDITDAEAAQIIASDLGTATQVVEIYYCSNLTTADLSKLKSAINIKVFNNPALKTLNLSGLKSITGSLIIEFSPQLTTLRFDSLEYALLGYDEYQYSSSNIGDGGGIAGTNLTQLSFPSLTKIVLTSSSSNSYSYSQFVFTGNNQLQSISFPVLTEIISVGNYYYNSIEIDDNITSLSMPVLTKGNLYVSGYNTPVSVTIPELTEGNISFNNISSTSFALPNFTNGSVNVGGSALTSFSLPKFDSGSVSVSSPLLTSLSLPVYIKGDFSLYQSALTSLTIPQMTAGSISVQDYSGNTGNPNLTSLSFPKLTKLTGMQIYNSPVLSTLTLPTLTAFGSSNNNYNPFSIQGSQLSSASVNAILANLVQITPAITGAQIYLQMTPAAPPTGQGITDKATLAANGNSVTTD